MSTDDDNDLTERYDELTGETLEDQWENADGPPQEYGRPGPRTIMDAGSEEQTYAWSWADKDDRIQFDGDLAWVVR